MKSEKILIPILFVVVISLSGCIQSSNSSYNYDEQIPSTVSGTFYVVNNTLTNGTYNTSNLSIMWDVLDDNYRKYYHVVPSDFVFVYNDRNTTEWDGDAGLQYSTFNDTLTGCVFRLNKNLTRGIAYETEGKFNLKDGFNITRTREQGNNYYKNYFNNIILANGTQVNALHIYDNLTLEQQKYFDDYEEQLYRYSQEKELREMDDYAGYLADMENEQTISNRIASNSKEGSFTGISTRDGYVRGSYY